MIQQDVVESCHMITTDSNLVLVSNRLNFRNFLKTLVATRKPRCSPRTTC